MVFLYVAGRCGYRIVKARVVHGGSVNLDARPEEACDEKRKMLLFKSRREEMWKKENGTEEMYQVQLPDSRDLSSIRRSRHSGMTPDKKCQCTERHTEA